MINLGGRALLCALLLTASAAPGQEAAPAVSGPSDDANVFIYRDYAEPKAWAPTVAIDGRKISSIGQDRYVAVRLAPGAHRIKLSWPFLAGQRGAEGSFIVAEDQHYYFEITGTVRVLGGGFPYMTFLVGSGFIPRGEEARAQIAECCKLKSTD